MTQESDDIKSLKKDVKNFNRHTKEGMELLRKSIEENKFGRSILVDKDGNIIAGNATAEMAEKLGKRKIKIIETDGEELVVVKRTDLDIESKEARELALLDNTTSERNLLWDAEKIKQVAEQLGMSHKELEELGLPGRVISHVHSDIDRSPIDFSIDKYLYRPQGNPKPIRMCINTDLYDGIIERIGKSKGLTQDEKEVLRLCAYRFIEINMSDMAEYYCHASKAMRKAMEDNCLVIVDGEGLLEKGLIKVSKDIQEILQLEIDS